MFRWSVTAGKAPTTARSITSNGSRFINSNEFRLGLNRFADEFRSNFSGFRSTGRHCNFSSSVSSYEDVSDDSLPSSIDWREKGAVVGVKDQGSCDLKDPYSQPGFLKKCSDLNLKELYGDGQTQNTPAAAERSEEEVRLLYEEWFLKHRKSDNALDEKESRFQVFRDKLKCIDKHNAAADAGEKTYRLGLNCFSDLTSDEVCSKFTGFRSTGRHCHFSSVSSRYEDVSDDSLPISIDWREKSVVGVKDQGSCDLKDPYSQPGFLKECSDLNLKELYGDGQTQNTPAAAERSEEEVRLLYEEWFLKHRKSDNALDEKESRFQVFRDNLKFIDEHNAAADAGEKTYRAKTILWV